MSENKVGAPARELTEFEQGIYQVCSRLGTGEGWDDWDVKDCNLRFESATPGPPAQASYLLVCTQKLCNWLGNLHGGCAATLIDMLSSVTLIGASRPGMFSLGGVSRHLGVTYLRPVPMGIEMRLVTKVVHMGRRLTLLRSEIYRVDTGDLCMVSDHEKVNTDPEASGKM
ncbi:hypothetical protein P175DRAFT_0558939 [Aspergillus ochraceoroseus IBT 24754]|uniref:Thioesterase domain-containing protein n=2 Tax=Aspergillus ochraceoroseus TaxID=138278 RepID=A0A2T5LSX4_9EURO|nr:uncharacterized protein P175DRAFT_0558939 [Aspergillus ochraceoroseus IBT 24754]KKK17990.1 hypothetical protein AOCH_001718 [Aspergillus ochraceoroseus]PTU19376.1 hypothetical protein P175DRAFT_0558939 [Aspergillus ochraceoroseus IBT 24754]